MKTTTPRGSVRAFSMVELLVVLGVVGLLAGLLLPSVLRARAAGDAARCLANERQLQLAAELYWDDHDGRSFTERTVATNGGWKYWFGWLQDGPEGSRAFDPSQGALWPYAPAGAVSVCPALNRCAAWYKPKGQALAYGYAYNLLLGPRGLAPLVVWQAAAPDRLAVFADGGQVNTFLAPASPDNPTLEEFFYFDADPTDATVHFRHRGRAEAAFGDGHVEPLTPLAGSLDTRLPQEIIGRLDPWWVIP